LAAADALVVGVAEVVGDEDGAAAAVAGGPPAVVDAVDGTATWGAEGVDGTDGA